MQRILILDNYDSFTYNLAHLIEGIGVEVVVVRNDEFDLKDLDLFDKVVLSPGPGLPEDAGKMMELLSIVKVPVLGVCLGMQAMCLKLGGFLLNKEEVKHGVSDLIKIENGTLFKGLKNEISVGLYHSWSVNVENTDVVVNATGSDGTIMAIESVKDNFYGVQFHPESILTDYGREILANFLKLD